MPLVEHASITEAALLAAVIANPVDDLPRLAYADLLEERGESGDGERAELIRVQLELARRDGCGSCDKKVRRGWSLIPPCDRCLGLAEQQRWLMAGLRDEVSWPVTWILGCDVMPCVSEKGWGWLSGNIPESIRWRIQRGFVSEVCLPCHDWMRYGPALVKAAPLELVWLTDTEPYDYAFDDGRSTWHFADDVPDFPDCLPSALFAQLTDGMIKRMLGEWREYDSQEDAVADLSRACLKWAREQS